MKKEKILFIIWSFSYGGGAEKILANLINGLDDEKYEVDVLEFYYAGIKEEIINKDINRLKPILDGTKKGIINKLKIKIINKLVLVFPRLIRKIYLNKKYDIEIAFNYMIPSFLLDKNNKKTLAWVHSSIYDLNDNKMYKRLQKRHFKKIGRIISISNLTNNSIIELYPELENKVRKIYNGFNFDEIIENAKLNEKNVEKADLLYCGRLEDRKKPLRLLDITKELTKIYPNIKVGYLGSGDLEKELKDKIKQLDLEQNVILYGFQKNPYRVIKNARIMCVTSCSEGFPTVIVEGMVLGKPFVSTPVAGTSELSCNEKCGFVTDDNEKYANIIVELLTNKEMYNDMSKNCLSECKKYTIENQVKELEKILEEI